MVLFLARVATGEEGMEVKVEAEVEGEEEGEEEEEEEDETGVYSASGDESLTPK